MDKFSHVVSASKAILRRMYRELTADEAVHGDSETAALEERVVEFCNSQGDLALFPELTALNGNKGDKYDAFWEAANTYINTTLTTGAEANRHGTSLYLAQPTSVPDFVRSVTKQVHQAPREAVLASFRPSRDRPRRWSSVFKSLTFIFMICGFVRSMGSRSELDIRIRAERTLLVSFRVDRRFLPLVSFSGRSMRLVCNFKPSFKQSGQHHSKMSELTMQSSSTKQPSRHSERLWNAKSE